MAIYNTQLSSKWFKISRHIINKKDLAQEYNGILSVSTPNGIIYIAKNSTKFRLKSHLDWAYYTPKTLADAVNNSSVDSYYEVMLKDANSDPNQWKDQDLELLLKSYYAARVNRASLI